MGCANSKDRGEEEINHPLPRSMSMPVHHPAEKKGDSYHVVALTSSTYGILKMDPVKDNNSMEDETQENCNAPKKRDLHGYYSFRRSLNRSSEMASKTWSEVNNLINNYTPFKSASHSKTPSQEEGQPETINTWELMEGLEDNTSPLVLRRKSAQKSLDRTLDRSFSFHSVKDVEQLARDEPKRSIWHRVTPGVKLAEENSKSKKFIETENGYEGLMDSPKNLKFSAKPPRNVETEKGYEGLMDSPKNLKFSAKPPRNVETEKGYEGDLMDSPGDLRRPLWMQEAGDDEYHQMSPTFFDPDLISTFRKALDDVSPRDPMEPICAPPSPYEKGISGGGSRLRSSSFQSRLNTFQQKIDEGKQPKTPKKSSAKAAKQKAPPGGEDKVVLYFTSLRGIRKTFEDCCTVKMILNGFRVWVDERDISMHAVFRQELHDLVGKPATVPRLFIRGKYIGGVEDIQQLHEVGELAKYLEGFPVNTRFDPCDGCGDVRFVPCPDCDGSRKVFREEGSLMVVRCLQCNENGLIRCPVCCS